MLDFEINKNMACFSCYNAELDESFFEPITDDDLLDFYNNNVQGIEFEQFLNSLKDYEVELSNAFYQKYGAMLNAEIADELYELEQTKNDEKYSNDYYHKQGIF